MGPINNFVDFKSWLLVTDVMVIPSLPSHFVMHFRFQLSFSTGKRSSNSHGAEIQKWGGGGFHVHRRGAIYFFRQGVLYRKATGGALEPASTKTRPHLLICW